MHGNLYNAIISTGIEGASPSKFVKLREYISHIQSEPTDYAGLCDQYVSYIEFLSLAKEAIDILGKSYLSSDISKRDSLLFDYETLEGHVRGIRSQLDVLVDSGQDLSVSNNIGREFSIMLKKPPEKYDLEFENIKNSILVNKDLLPIAHNKRNFLQLMIVYPFTPLYPSATIKDIASRFFYIKANIDSPKDLAKELGTGYLIINKISRLSIEYNIWKLIDNEYIAEHKLDYDKNSGVNSTNIERMANVIEHINEAENLDIEHDIKDKNIVLDTFNGKTYRLLAKSGESIIDGNWLQRLIDPSTSTPKALECYNRYLESEYNIQSPVDVMKSKRLDWRDIIDQLAIDIKKFLEKAISNQKPSAKLLREAISTPEFYSKIRTNIEKYIASKDLNIKEVFITAENELNGVVITLIRNLSTQFSSARIFKEKDPISKLMYRVRDVLVDIFNNNNNLFTAIHQKYLICTAFKQ